jgi:hypothetical protein
MTDTGDTIRIDDHTRVYVDQWEEDTKMQVYISLQLHGASARCTMNRDKAQQLIDALQKVIDAIA